MAEKASIPSSGVSSAITRAPCAFARTTIAASRMGAGRRETPAPVPPGAATSGSVSTANHGSMRSSVAGGTRPLYRAASRSQVSGLRSVRKERPRGSSPRASAS